MSENKSIKISVRVQLIYFSLVGCTYVGVNELVQAMCLWSYISRQGFSNFLPQGSADAQKLHYVTCLLNEFI